MTISPSSSPLGISSGSFSSSLGENFITLDTTWLPTSTVRPNARFSTTKMLRGGCRYTCSGSSCKIIMHGVHRSKGEQPVLSYQTMAAPSHMEKPACTFAKSKTCSDRPWLKQLLVGNFTRFSSAAEQCDHGRSKSWRQFPPMLPHAVRQCTGARVAMVYLGMAESTFPLTTSMYFMSSVKLGFSL